MIKNKAQEYQSKKRKVMLFNMVLTPCLLIVLLITGLSFWMKAGAEAVSGENFYGCIFLYFVFLSLFFMIFDLPLSFYSGFILEHKFKLSNQSIKGWIKDFLKKSILSFLLSLILIIVLYALIKEFPEKWWVIAWVGYAFVSYVLGKIFPVLIVPIFYKYGDLEDKELKEKILKLATRFKMPVGNVCSLNLSKTTKKANAAFMGFGKTKKVVLSDTLINNFSHDEIEIVMAHELGHFKNKDIWRLLGFGLVTSFIAFAVGFLGMNFFSCVIGLSAVSDIAGLPLLFLIFYVVGVVFMPLQNGYSRKRENLADIFALRVCKNSDAFISCMQKLAKTNLSEMEPPGWYEWLFCDHPPIGKRIKLAESFVLTKNLP